MEIETLFIPSISQPAKSYECFRQQKKKKKNQKRQTCRNASNYFLPYSTTEAEATRYICTYQKSLCFEFSTVQPTPPKQKNSMKDERVRRRLEEMQCLAPRLRSRGTVELGTEVESPALTTRCRAALPPCRQLQEEA